MNKFCPRETFNINSMLNTFSSDLSIKIISFSLFSFKSYLSSKSLIIRDKSILKLKFSILNSFYKSYLLSDLKKQH